MSSIPATLTFSRAPGSVVLVLMGMVVIGLVVIVLVVIVLVVIVQALADVRSRLSGKGASPLR
jgi:uncharacterized membrane protein